MKREFCRIFICFSEMNTPSRLQAFSSGSSIKNSAAVKIAAIQSPSEHVEMYMQVAFVHFRRKKTEH